MNPNMESHSIERTFAVDLVSFVSSALSIPYIPTGTFSRSGLYADSPFKKNTREAVDYFVVKLARTSEDNFNKHLNFDYVGDYGFSQYLRRMSTNLLGQNFSIYRFLGYCTFICMLGVSLQKKGVHTAPNFCVEEIIYVLHGYKSLGVFPHEMWDNMEEYAAKIGNSESDSE